MNSMAMRIPRRLLRGTFNKPGNGLCKTAKLKKHKNPRFMLSPSN
jgi:hypothetical protein